MTSRIDREDEGKPVRLARTGNFTLGAVEVRPATREIVHGQARAVLEPRVMEVLVVLAEARGAVVSRDELIARCWDGRVVSEDAINRVIAGVRRAAQGIGAGSWTVETIIKVGFRIVEDPAAPAAGPAPAAAAGAPPGLAGLNRRTALLLAAGGVTAAGLGALAFLRRKPSVSPEAKALYDNARSAMRQAYAEQNAEAQGLLKKAIAVQPDYADAWGALALAYQGGLQFAPADGQARLTAQAAAAADQALKLDPDNADGQVTLALLAPVYRNWVAAEALYVRALRAAPDHGVLQAAYGTFLAGVGRIREAVAALRLAVKADPYAPYYRYQLATGLWAAGQLDEAERILAEARRIWPRHYALWFLRFWTFAYTGRTDQAVAHAARSEGRPINIPETDFALYVLTAQAIGSRDPAAVDRAIAVNLEASRRGQGYAENAMLVQSYLGRLDGALQTARALYLGDGFKVGSQRWADQQGMYVPRDERKTLVLFGAPATPLRRDPRFQTLVADMGLAAYWEASGHPPDYRVRDQPPAP